MNKLVTNHIKDFTAFAKNNQAIKHINFLNSNYLFILPCLSLVIYKIEFFVLFWKVREKYFNEKQK